MKRCELPHEDDKLDPPYKDSVTSAMLDGSEIQRQDVGFTKCGMVSCPDLEL